MSNRDQGKTWNQWKNIYKFHAKTPGGGPAREDVAGEGIIRVTLDDVPYWGFTSEEARDAFIQTYNAEIVL